MIQPRLQHRRRPPAIPRRTQKPRSRPPDAPRRAWPAARLGSKSKPSPASPPRTPSPPPTRSSRTSVAPSPAAASRRTVVSRIYDLIRNEPSPNSIKIGQVISGPEDDEVRLLGDPGSGELSRRGTTDRRGVPRSSGIYFGRRRGLFPLPSVISYLLTHVGSFWRSRTVCCM